MVAKVKERAKRVLHHHYVHVAVVTLYDNGQHILFGFMWYALSQFGGIGVHH